MNIGDARAGFIPLIHPINRDARPGWLARILYAIAILVLEFKDLQIAQLAIGKCHCCRNAPAYGDSLLDIAHDSAVGRQHLGDSVHADGHVGKDAQTLSIGDARAGFSPLVLPVDGDARPGGLARILYAIAIFVLVLEDFQCAQMAIPENHVGDLLRLHGCDNRGGRGWFSIGWNCFRYCPNLRTDSVPDDITILISVTIPALTTRRESIDVHALQRRLSGILDAVAIVIEELEHT